GSPVAKSADWVQNRVDLIDTLKQKLDDAGFKERYPQLYYWLNGTIGQFEQTIDNPFQNHPIEGLLMPDQSMRKSTKEQLAYANYIADQLANALADDEQMRRQLTVFSDIPAESVVDRFIENRRNVADREH